MLSTAPPQAPTPAPPTPAPGTPMPTTPTPMTDSTTCSTGIAGVERDGYCCSLGCGICGGYGCSKRAREAGLMSKDCCISRISNSGVYCGDSGAAPCIIDDVPAPTPVPALSSCSNGIAGVERDGYCCSPGCGTCGGTGCSKRARQAGLLPDDCCISRISDSEVYCNDTGMAPCIIGGGMAGSYR